MKTDDRSTVANERDLRTSAKKSNAERLTTVTGAELTSVQGGAMDTEAIASGWDLKLNVRR